MLFKAWVSVMTLLTMGLPAESLAVAPDMPVLLGELSKLPYLPNLLGEGEASPPLLGVVSN